MEALGARPAGQDIAASIHWVEDLLDVPPGDTSAPDLEDYFGL